MGWVFTLDWLDDAIRVIQMILPWWTYVVALWHSMRKPVLQPLQICKAPKKCKKAHRLAMVFRKGGKGVFVLVH